MYRSDELECMPALRGWDVLDSIRCGMARCDESWMDQRWLACAIRAERLKRLLGEVDVVWNGQGRRTQARALYARREHT